VVCYDCGVFRRACVCACSWGLLRRTHYLRRPQDELVNVAVFVDMYVELLFSTPHPRSTDSRRQTKNYDL